jgi:DNA modification methylase
MSVRILHGDCRDTLRTLPDASVHCCVTSPPYFGLRDYGNAAQIGLEPTPDEYVSQMVEVFREVRRVLSNDGTLWLNLGDSYAGGGTIGRNDAGRDIGGGGNKLGSGNPGTQGSRARIESLKAKDLIGIPWRVAFALQADGWFLRQDIIWHKPNPMPESVRDRCTKAHEYVFLLSKSERYFYDIEAMQEQATDSTSLRLAQDIANQRGSDRVPGKTNGAMKAVKGRFVRPGVDTNGGGQGDGAMSYPALTRNKRSVWTIATQPFSEAHFATMAPELAKTCIKAGCPEGGTVLDPFGGAGTTGLVADQLQRDAVLCELNPEYISIARRRIAADAPLFAEVTE